MDSHDIKTTDPVESALEIHDADLKHDLPRVDWTEEEEKKAKLK